MWIDKLIELKKKSGYSTKQIAEGTFLPERTISRIFAKETNGPSITTLIPIINFLGGSLDELFADTEAVIGNKKFSDLLAKCDLLTAEKNLLITEKDLLITENGSLKDQINNLNAKIELLELKLMHKEELLAVHNYYIKIGSK